MNNNNKCTHKSAQGEYHSIGGRLDDDGGVNMNEMNGEPDAGHYHPNTSTRAVHSLNGTVVSLHLSSRCICRIPKTIRKSS